MQDGLTTRTPDRLELTPSTQPYLQAYLLMRVAIGVLGICLPIMLLAGEILFLRNSALRGSLSAYYYSGMRDVFVGSLCAIGVFLVTYMVTRPNLDNVLSIAAGVGAFGVALFPTGRPEGIEGLLLTPLQERLEESVVSKVHLVSAVVFLLSLAAISWRFGIGERYRPDRPSGKARERWYRFHRNCSIVIILALVGVALTKGLDVADTYSLLVGESVAVLAFGISWLAKGSELDILLARLPAQPADSPAARRLAR